MFNMTPWKETYHSMPVQFTNSAFLQVLLSTSNIGALRKILNDLLSRPATWKQLSLRLGETPLDVGNEAVISLGRAKLVGVLEIHGLVGSACCQAF